MAMVAPMNGEVVLLGGDMGGITLNAFHLGLFNVALDANLLCSEHSLQCGERSQPKVHT